MLVRPLSQAVRTASARSVAPVVSVSSRRIHMAAEGELHKYKDTQEIEHLSKREPTMISTMLSRQHVLKANPHLPDIERNLRAKGHDVAYDIDATQLHKFSNPNVSKMMLQAKQRNINMQKMSVPFLRSGSEKRPDDRALIEEVAQSAAKSGVTHLEAIHTADRFNSSAKYHAPDSTDWTPAALKAGFKHIATIDEKRNRVVESVTRESGGVDQHQIYRVGISTFNRS